MALSCRGSDSGTSGPNSEASSIAKYSGNSSSLAPASAASSTQAEIRRS